MIIFGYGQGNIDNVAEFFNWIYFFWVDGVLVMFYYFWKVDCVQNICVNQLGIWLFFCVGWCFGQEVILFIVNLMSLVMLGVLFFFDYVLEDYINFLNIGYNGSFYIEFYYWIYVYFVE